MYAYDDEYHNFDEPTTNRTLNEWIDSHVSLLREKVPDWKKQGFIRPRWVAMDVARELLDTLDSFVSDWDIPDGEEDHAVEIMTGLKEHIYTALDHVDTWHPELPSKWLPGMLESLKELATEG